jgi:uncharacterized membrane protein YeiH
MWGAGGCDAQAGLFGVLVLSFAAGNSGGIARDVLIGARQAPSAIGAISASRSLSIIIRLWNPVLLFDAAGLAFFAVSGAQRRSTMAWTPSWDVSKHWRRHDTERAADRDSYCLLRKRDRR